MKLKAKISTWILLLGILFMLGETSCVAQKKGKKSKEKVEEVKTEVKEEVKTEENPNNEFGCPRFGVDKKKSLESASMYYEFYKQADYTSALPHWKYLFDNAPGLRQNTFVRGETMYKEFIAKEQDPVKKEELIGTLFQIIEKYGDCWGKKGSALGRKALYLQTLYEGKETEVLELFKQAIETDGNKTDADILSPYAGMLFGKLRANEVTQAEFDATFKKIEDICNHNIQLAGEDAGAYQQALQKLKSVSERGDKLEDLDAKNGINNCESAKAYYQPKLQAEPNNLDLILKYFANLSKYECKDDPEYDRMLLKRADIDPNVSAGIVYMAGNLKMQAKDYQAAKSYLNRALGMYAGDAEKQSAINYSLGNIYYSEKNATEAARYYNNAFPGLTTEKKGKVKMKLASMAFSDGDFPTARNLAEEAATFMPNDGSPYILIGQLYASSGKKCGPGTGWDSQVVTWCAVDAWYKAKQIDPSVAAEAQEKINKYSQYFPSKQEAFMSKGKNEGESYFVGCWIQRSTTVRLK